MSLAKMFMYGLQAHPDGWVAALAAADVSYELRHRHQVMLITRLTAGQTPLRVLYATPIPSTPAPSSQDPADPMLTGHDSGAAEGASDEGHGLGGNLAVQAARADWLYHSRRFQARY